MLPIPSLDEWRADATYISFNGHRIFTRAVGSGPPVIVLHGFPTASYDYARLVPLLANRYRLLLFDFLGYGFSDKPRQHEYSLFEQAAITQAAAAHYGYDRLFMLAHDMGDSVALEVLRRETPRVDRLILLNGSVLLDDYRPLLLQKLLLHPQLGPLISRLRLIQRRSFGRQFGSVFAQRPPDDEIDAFWSLIRHHDGLSIYHLLIRYLNERKIHEHMWLDALKAHTAPLAVIWGLRDPVAVPSIAQAILTRRPDARYIPLETIGHYPQWEAPERVAAAVREAFG